VPARDEIERAQNQRGGTRRAHLVDVDTEGAVPGGLEGEKIELAGDRAVVQRGKREGRSCLCRSGRKPGTRREGKKKSRLSAGIKACGGEGPPAHQRRSGNREWGKGSEKSGVTILRAYPEKDPRKYCDLQGGKKAHIDDIRPRKREKEKRGFLFSERSQRRHPLLRGSFRQKKNMG